MELNSIKINGVDVPLENVCEECGGDGFTAEHDPFDPHEGGVCSSCPIQVQCESCEGTGKQTIYYTPDHLTAYIRKNGDPNFIDIRNTEYAMWMYHTGKDHYFLCSSFEYDSEVNGTFVAFPYQPAPPADYKVKE